MRKTTYAWLFVLPSLIMLFAIIIGPWVASIYLSFINLSFAMPGSGQFSWDNMYRSVFSDPKLYSSIARTLMLGLPSLAIQIIAGVFIAWGLYSLGVGRKVRLLLAFFIIPMILPSSVVALTWYFITHSDYGLLTYILRSVGLLGSSAIWSNRITVIPAYILVDSWQWIPFSTLIIWAGMNAVPIEIVDSAHVDGARGFFFFRKVLFPAISPIVGIILLLRGMDLFKFIDPIIIITYGGPGDASETIHFFAYREAFSVWNVSYGVTVSMIIFFIIECASALYVKFFMTRLYVGR